MVDKTYSKELSMRDRLRQLGAGRILYQTLGRPSGYIRKSMREGGPIAQWRTRRGERQMVDAAMRMRQLSPPQGSQHLNVSLLSGSRFWHQTMFCLVSLQNNIDIKVTPTILSDGTLTAEQRNYINMAVPWAQFPEADEIEERINNNLPSNRYPLLNTARANMAHMRKLIDAHIEKNDWSVSLDSDVLFFKQPDTLVDWCRRPFAFYMADHETLYGYNLPFMRGLSPKIPERVNVGFYGIDRSRIDWDWIEYCCKKQSEIVGVSFFKEQGLTALILGEQEAIGLPPELYRLSPSFHEGKNPTAVMHHYVEWSKRSFFQHGWRIVQKTGGIPKSTSERS